MGRKPLGDKALTDAERQRRRRQKLRAARADSVTPPVTENGQDSAGRVSPPPSSGRTPAQDVSVTDLSRKLDELSRENVRLKKVNQALRRDVKHFAQGYDEQIALANRLQEEITQLHRRERERLEKELERKERERLDRESQEYQDWKRDRELDGLFATLNRLAGPRTVAQVLRQASRLFHPDRGGTDEQMTVVNKIREMLEQLLAQHKRS
jgi:hypothetical protein